MFSIAYQIVNLFDEVPIGSDGYLRIDCNEHHFGEIFPPELESIIDDTFYIYDWIEGFLVAAEILYQHEKKYIFLNDVDSYIAWIQLVRQGDIIEVSLIFYDKAQCKESLMLEISNCSRGETKWKGEIPAIEYYNEVDRVSKQYLQEINHWPENAQYVQQLKERMLSFKENVMDQLSDPNGCAKMEIS